MALTLQEDRDKAQAICTEVKDGCERIYQRVNELTPDTMTMLVDIRAKVRTIIRGFKW